ncbi:beta-glucosidase family protein [Rugosimonospora africana]|uniref:Beta-glucosidase n=1 Tax=Rugosimonospora africana TaxID=556532 RepID=A0A8J3QVA5_9ACTN|nr:glycoside hydrolase family 3 N-terminal domain-containing protein [Rugosimonospora africana]GIH16433.1 beta-glucosidase [Rugosimonospora africana]
MTHDSDLPQDTWRDVTAPTAARVADLMARMTVREKLAQLYGVWVQVDEVAGAVAPHQGDQAPDPLDWDELIRHGLGQITRVYGSAPVDPIDGARRVANLQGQVTKAGRFGVPAIVHEEILTGLAAWQATIYPSPLCWGASFDPELSEAIGAQIGGLMRRLGVQQGLAPVLDVVRDLRWGRVEETIGEDPYLVGIIGSGYVRGVESAGVVATLKHFAGYSASRAGRNLAPVSIGRREIADVLLPPFEMALQAGARSVMSNYTDLDGVPVAADPALLTEVLRERYGFTGTVVSDYFGIAFLQTLHGVAASRADAAELALRAGIDVELPGMNCYGQPLVDAVESGRVDIALIDRALTRVLRQKCELGLLDPDWSAQPPALSAGVTTLEIDDEASRQLARRAAQRSIVLLRNEPPGSVQQAGSAQQGDSAQQAGSPVLPLAPGLRLAVVGPGADEPDAMLGCYSFPRHVGIHHSDLPKGVAIPSLVESLRADPAGYEVRYVQGCPVTGGDDAGIADAVAVARCADVCLVVLGDLAGLFGAGTSGEGCDAVDLRLPGRQEELLEAVLATGTPVVLVLLLGRPYELSRQVDRLAAAVCAFFPGEEGAPALADVLSGRVNPSGHLPVSFPGAGASQPSTYLAAPLAQRSEVSTVDPTPLFPFGHGLSYAPVCWGEVTLNGPSLWPAEGSSRLSVTLRNESDRDSSEVIQVYLHDPVAEVVRPLQRLIGAARVDLAAGDSRTVLMDLHADLTSYAGLGGERIVEPGEVELWVGASSTDIRARLHLIMTGPRRTVGFDRVMHPKVTVLAQQALSSDEAASADQMSR